MKALLRLSGVIDAISRLFGRIIIWLVLAATLISATNAIARKLFNIGSNAILEIQWYLFAAVFLLGAGYTFLKDAHVRVDVVANRLSMSTRILIDILGILVFLLPLCWFMIVFSWPILVQAYQSGEVSSNSGGLIRWPVYALVPAGFALLGLQGISELIKRVAFLRGLGPNPLIKESPEDVAVSPTAIGPADSATTAPGVDSAAR
ncbi:TRAP transporter small permease subunit [Thiocapsa sp. UBA6158]|jgi:TRAP-type mannitol/chloroaromatic compound transport system permease small subunit|uniref:TRAP transporter small permease subunit n=1 Tax=Thiocapsa sp. UBA6158 TaxID=1947692 RepID=UPI0025EA295B|nr:TRAP transporter small permease subunit [Thiocapsa sp. UBA6158]